MSVFLIAENQYSFPPVGIVIFKAFITFLVCILLILISQFLGPIVTFIGFDFVFAVYLFSLFRGNLRYLFLLHPIISLVTSFGFEIPYTDIGVGYTYMDTFQTYVNSSTLAWNFNLIIENLMRGDGPFGFGILYIGILPIVWLPKVLFFDAPDITIYFSIGVFTLLYASTIASIGIATRVIKKEILLMITLFSSVSPTFLEMNSSLNRYGLLFLGVYLFINGYLGLTRKKISLLMGIFIIFFALTFVIISKIVLVFSLLLFVLTDFYLRYRFTQNIVNFDVKIRWILAIGVIAILQYFGKYMIPQHYAYISQTGAGLDYLNLLNMPVIGLVLRIIYATFSPFPWANFTQFELYGENHVFLLIHILSVITAVLLFLSCMLNFKKILNEQDDMKSVVLYGVCIMSSLAFSAIGYHVYLTPALPFFSPLLLEKYRAPIILPVMIVTIMEILAQITRFLK